MFVMETEQLNHLTLGCSVESTETKLNYFLSGNISVWKWNGILENNPEMKLK